MAQSAAKPALKAAKKAIMEGKFTEALAEARTALQHDEFSYDAHLICGKAHYGLAQYSCSEAAYRCAVDVDPAGVPAWKGLAELHWAAGDAEKTVEAYEKLLELTEGQQEAAGKRGEWRWRLADAYARRGRFKEARAVLPGACTD